MKRTIETKTPLTPQQQLRSLTEQIVEGGTFFPNGVHIEDMDKAVQLVLKNDFEITSEGEKIPVMDIFSIQRFAEYMKIWQHTDEGKNIKLPFIVVVKEPTKRGTNLGSTFNVPSSPKFNLWRRPIMKNGKQTCEYYRIAQPVNIDLPYTLHLFTEKQRDVNKMDELMLHSFKESQYYVNVMGHHMPLNLEDIGDDSKTSDIDARRFYHKTYSMVLKGYLLREQDFEKLTSIDTINIKLGEGNVKMSRECVVTEIDLDCDLCLNFQFNRKSGNSKSIKIPMDLNFYYDNQNPLNDYSYFVNQTLVTLPFNVKKGDELTVAHNITTKTILNIKLCGQKM